MQRLGDLLAKTPDLLAERRRVDVNVADRAPVDELAFGYDRQHSIVAPFGLVAERRNREVQDSEDEVSSREGPLARKNNSNSDLQYGL